MPKMYNPRPSMVPRGMPKPMYSGPRHAHVRAAPRTPPPIHELRKATACVRLPIKPNHLRA
jgi:hypothetical protein